MVKAVIKEVALDLIDRPEDLARLEIEASEIEGLAESIRERGLQQPIKVARRDERFRIIFGDRRFLACKFLEWKTIQATVVDATDEEIAIDRAIENIQRVDLTQVEEGLEYERLVEAMGMTPEEIGKRMGKETHTIRRRLRLIKYPRTCKNGVHSGKLSGTVAEILMGCTDEAYRDYLLENAIENGITAEIARMWIEDWRKRERGKANIEQGGRGDEPLPLERKSYIACGLCEEPVEVTKLKSITVCEDCLGRLYDMLHGKEPQTGGG